VNQIDEINSVMRLQKEFGFKLIINGAGEAHLIANSLAAAGVSVILNPLRQPPDSFLTWNVIDNSASILFNAGVKVGISQTLPDQVSNLRWEAAFAQSMGVPYINALEMISSNIAQMYNLDVGTITVGKQANFVVFNGDPLSIKTSILLIGIGNHILCEPERSK
jgi:imidazolonepropionase-like amidohydrolase